MREEGRNAEAEMAVSSVRIIDHAAVSSLSLQVTGDK